MELQHTQFIDPLPKLSNSDWFNLNERVDDDALLTQEENQYKFMMKELADKAYDLLSIGEIKEGSEIAGDDDIEEDEESAGVLDDETDEYDGASPDTGAILNPNQEVEMEERSNTVDGQEASNPWT